MNCCYPGRLKPIYKGDDSTIAMVVIMADGSKMNFNGKTIKFIVKKSKTEDDSKAIILKEYSPTQDMTKLDIQLTKSDTDVAPGFYWYGVRVSSFDYQVTEGEGRLEIKQGAFYGK